MALFVKQLPVVRCPKDDDEGPAERPLDVDVPAATARLDNEVPRFEAPIIEVDCELKPFDGLLLFVLGTTCWLDELEELLVALFALPEFPTELATAAAAAAATAWC